MEIIYDSGNESLEHGVHHGQELIYWDFIRQRLLVSLIIVADDRTSILHDL